MKYIGHSLYVKQPSYKVNTIIISIFLVGEQRLRERFNNVPTVTLFTSGRQASKPRQFGSMLITTVLSLLPRVTVQSTRVLGDAEQVSVLRMRTSGQRNFKEHFGEISRVANEFRKGPSPERKRSFYSLKSRMEKREKGGGIGVGRK